MRAANRSSRQKTDRDRFGCTRNAAGFGNAITPAQLQLLPKKSTDEGGILSVEEVIFGA